mgnify:CR=1 FL=1
MMYFGIAIGFVMGVLATLLITALVEIVNMKGGEVKKK